MKGLPRSFYCRKTDAVAKELIGKVLFHETREGAASGVIVETEAYFGSDDPASHAATRGVTPRNAVMYGPPGRAYVYFCYGAHFLFNVVTEKKGTAGAVLIRGLEPLEGLPLMLRRRKTENPSLATNGPGKLTAALSIGPRQNKQDLVSGSLVILEGNGSKIPIKQSSRIGISDGKQLLHRYYWAGNPYVSVKPNK